jgi:hypothetical protein
LYRTASVTKLLAMFVVVVCGFQDFKSFLGKISRIVNFHYHDCHAFLQWIKRILQTRRQYINNPCSTSEPEFFSCFSDVRVAWSLVLCVLLGRSLFVLFYFFFWPLCCLSFFDSRIVITPLVSSNSSLLTTNTCNWCL